MYSIDDYVICAHLSLFVVASFAMDATDGITPLMDSSMLSYDDTVAYEEQLPTEQERAAAAARTASLVNRVGNSKVYLLSESTATTRNTKVRLVP